MAPQLTLQAPHALPPAEVQVYLDQLWQQGLEASSGAATFTLVVWDGAWLEQQLVRSGRVDGPITGLLREEVLTAAREAAQDCGLPLGTAPMDPQLAWAIGRLDGGHRAEDLRGQFVDRAISAHQPRRLITLAPTLEASKALESLVAAYCPLPEERGMTADACGDVVGNDPARIEGVKPLRAPGRLYRLEVPV